MKRSRFRLQTLLNVKAYIEQEKQRILGTAVAKTLLQQEKLARLLKEKEQLMNRQRDTLALPMSPAQMLMYSRYLLRVKREEFTVRELIKALKLEEEKRRADLLAATKEKKILEKLKEKQQKEELKRVDQAELKAQDELSLATFSRNLH